MLMDVEVYNIVVLVGTIGGSIILFIAENWDALAESLLGDQ